MKKPIIIILALILTLNSTIITSANTTYLTGKTFINNVKNISFNNNWECNEIEDIPGLPKNVRSEITGALSIETIHNQEIINIYNHKHQADINNAKYMVSEMLKNKSLNLKDFKSYKEYELGNNEYVYSVSNVNGLYFDVEKKYASILIYLKSFSLEKKTFICTRIVGSKTPISSIDSYLPSLKNKISILNVNYTVKRIRPLSKKSIAHLKRIQKYIKKNKSRKIVKTASSSLKNYEESYMTKFKKKSRFKDVLFLTWGAYSKKESAKNFYKVVSRSANTNSKLKSFKRKITKLKKKQYKARIYTIYNKKRKICGIIIVGINTKTNVVMTATIKKEKISKRNIKNFKRKYIKFIKKILKG